MWFERSWHTETHAFLNNTIPTQSSKRLQRIALTFIYLNNSFLQVYINFLEEIHFKKKKGKNLILLILHRVLSVFFTYKSTMWESNNLLFHISKYSKIGLRRPLGSSYVEDTQVYGVLGTKTCNKKPEENFTRNQRITL